MHWQTIVKNALVASTLIGCIGVTLPVLAQDGKLQMGHLNKLAGKAVEAVDVSFDETLLRAMATTRSAEAPDPEKFKVLLSNLQSVFVKGFKFGQPGEYREADVEVLRAQLKAQGWKRIVYVQNKRSRDNGELFLRFQNETIVGVTVISALPDELYVVNVVGSIGVGEISMQEGVRGLSRLDVAWSRWRGNRSRGSNRNE